MTTGEGLPPVADGGRVRRAVPRPVRDDGRAFGRKAMTENAGEVVR
ncbi:hypothetical protein [Streptomyces fodineus]|nr:hypothetical protein [Streptomyces fodineus]